MKNQLKGNTTLEGIIYGLVGTALVNVIFSFLPKFWAQLFLGKNALEISLTFQDVMWGTFFMALALLRARSSELKDMEHFKTKEYLPESFEVIIDEEVLTEIIKKSKKDSKDKMGILPYMVLQISLQFRTNHSISITSDFLSKQIELFLHQVEIRYNKLKYIIWLIPSLGFMGTVYGIGVAVSELGGGNMDDPDLLTKMAGHLGVAFNTTLLALILSVVLQYFTQNFEVKEENLINDFGKYILDNFVNKIIEK